MDTTYNRARSLYTSTLFRLVLPLTRSNGREITDQEVTEFIELEVTRRISTFVITKSEGYLNSRPEKYLLIEVPAVRDFYFKIHRYMQLIGEAYSIKFGLKAPLLLTFPLLIQRA